MPPAEQRIRFCTSADGARIAYAVAGQGPPLVKAANWLSHLEFDWGSPVWRHWLAELTRDHTLIRYDERGCGLSDWSADDYSLEAWVRDLEAVVDAAGLERFPLLGISQGGPIAIAYAVRHPERVSRLILYGSYVRGRKYRNLTDEQRIERELMLQMIRVGWGQDHPAFRQVFTSFFIPDATPEQVSWFNELQRISAPPENAYRIVSGFDGLDVRSLLHRVTAPTLVLHATGDLRIPIGEGRLLAEGIPGARFVPLESRNHLLLETEAAWPRFVAEVRAFLGVPADTRPILPDAARRREIEALFDRAADLPPAERPGFLAGVCGDDRELRREVEALLASLDAPDVTRRIAVAVGGAVGEWSDGAVEPALTQYEVLERLGGGGMGVVHRARDRRLGRYVALKYLRPGLGDDAEVRRRFVQEARVVASLDHPNICAILEIEQTADGRLVIVMPCYEGETLKAKIARGPLPVAEALEYARQMADGLAHAHATGVVHRDVKPANVLVARDGRVKLLDFGIAKLADADLTRSGLVLGTLAYMSPEQAIGEPVDRRTDLWSLGVVLYEMLTGRPPFRGDGYEAVLHALRHCDPVPIRSLRPEVPPEVEAAVMRLLAKRPDDRFPDAASARAALSLPTGGPS